MEKNPVWHAQSSEDVLKQLGTSAEKGLTSEQASAALEEYGYNELPEKRQKTLAERLIEQLTDFLVLILIGASIVSALVGEVTDAIVIIGIVIINAALGVYQEAKADRALGALRKMAAPEADVIRGGSAQRIQAREIVPGDLVILEAGDYVPADVRLIETVNLKVDEAALSGESVPVDKDANQVLPEETAVSERSNMAFMGTTVTYGRGKGVVVGTGLHTQFGRIAELIQTSEQEKTPLQRRLEQLGKWLGIGVLVISAIIFITGVLRQQPLLETFMVAISLAVAAIPEGLPAVVTIVLALGMQRMIKRNVLIRRLLAVETLGTTTVICTDKTGTLTQNRMKAVSLYTNGKRYSVNPEARFESEGETWLFSSDGQKAAASDMDLHLRLSLEIGAMANDSRLEDAEADSAGSNERWRVVGEPTENALVDIAARAGLYKFELDKARPRVSEIPFDSARKRMTTIHPGEGIPLSLFADGGYLAAVKGAPDVVLGLCTGVLEDGEVKPLTPEKRHQILSVNDEMAGEALRVLALALRKLPEVPEEPSPEEVEEDLVFVGLIGMIDPPRPEVADAIELARQAGIRTVMVTGDHKTTALAIARQLGLTDENGKALTGDDLDRMSDEELAEAVKEANVFSRVSPEHKLRIVDAFKKIGHIRAMTGDGVNDAPALKRADIGVAMGITGTDVAKETSDMVLRDDNFASIVAAVEEGRIIYSNIRKFVNFLLSCNAGEISVIFVSMLLGWPVPLVPIQLLWVNLVTDSFPALALGMEKGEADVMKRPPRRPDEPILDKSMRRFVAVQAVAITVATLGAFYVGWHIYGSLSLGRTMAFGTLVIGELLRAHSSRSERQPLLSIGLLTNKTMLWATSLSLALMLLVLQIPALQSIFKTRTLTASHWVLMVSLGLIPFLAAEAAKYIGIYNGNNGK